MSVQTKMITQLRSLDDRSISRLTRIAALILVVGIPLFTAFYYFDRHVTSAPSIEDQTLAKAEEAVRANPNDIAARLQLAGAYLAVDQYANAITQFSEVLKAQPKNGSALVGRGLAEQRSNQADLAKADFQAYVDQNKTAELAGSDRQLELAYYQLGTILMAEGDNAAAKADFAAALKIDKSDADALYGFGTTSIRTGDAEKGLAALKMAVAFVPTGWCDPFQSMAEGYTALKDADGVTYATGMTAACQGKADAAKTALKSLAGTKYEADALIGLAYLASKQGDNDTAAALFQQVLDKDPANVSAAIGLKTVQTAAHAAAPASPASSGSN